jgi:hypothetical protein
LLIVLCASAAIGAEAREMGRGREVALLGTMPIVIYTYRPPGCAVSRILILFAGYHRDADRYRNRAIPLADRACLQLAAPLLDRERFPNWRYHRAGIYRAGRVQPKEQWTRPVLAGLIAWARKWVGRSDAPYILFGHSAGAQLLSRIAAYSPPEAPHRIVIANPSVYVFPSLEEGVPNGFQGIFDGRERAERLRAYLGLPVTIWLGVEDTGSRLLVDDEAARRQGRNRYERGKAVFAAGRETARRNSWPFNWTLVESPSVGHSSGDLLNSPQATEALGLKVVAPAR